ncbi:MAG: hypothetical protein DRJ05_19590, partial [Bacteroidetes bacterium]
VPTGTTGYWNLQKDVVIGTEWGFQVMFEDDMTMIVDAGAAAAAVVPYSYDTWYHNEIIVDLDNDWAGFYVDGEFIIGYQWTLGTFGTAGALTLGSTNIYANPGAGGTPPGAHFDNVCFSDVTPPPCENFDALTVGGYVAEQLGGMWTTWGGTNADDAFVSDDYSNSPDNSFVVNDGAIDLVRMLANDPIASGQHLYSNYMYVPSGFSGYFNVQSDPSPGVAWVVEVFLNDDGSAYVTENTIQHDFTYDMDTWILIEINFDMDNGLAQLLVDGLEIVQWINNETIGGIDYYGADTGGTPGAYYDDVCFGEGWHITAVEEIQEQDISVFPNPATDLVNIQSDFNITNIKVYNYAGQMVNFETVNSKIYQVNTSGLNAGIYFFQINTTEGSISKRIIIQ